ncbi:MAG TPA: RNA polymerase sigma factor [Symbiobacteriaceae bacterium]|nr:RNA polymerase sigma factor [Symbiobacteriaceae bacterium]
MELISDAPSGAEREALLWTTYRTRIYRYLYRLTGNAASAEDLTQETFLQALRDLRRLPAPPDNLSAWLYRIATHRAIDDFRRRQRFAWLPLLGERVAGAAADPAEAVAEHDLIFRVLRRLPRETAAMLLLRDAEGFTMTEIATMTGGNYEAVRKRLARAREMVRSEYLRLKGESEP